MRKKIFTKWFCRLMVIGLLAGSSVGLYAQRNVKGKVVDAQTKELIPGANVIVKGSTVGTTTDLDGAFTIKVPDNNAVLSISYIGYNTEEVPVGAQEDILITLVADIQSLQEVVVVGYGTVKKSDLTGSLSSVKAKELSAFPTTNAVQALSGRAAGVQVIQNNGSPGAGISVRVRGTNSIQGSNEPLYVIDGFPYSGTPTLLNNADIESMEILKDASATAIYGSRGANGVVLITTRQGKAGVTRVDYEGSYSIQTIRKKLDLMNAKQYAEFNNMRLVNDGQAPYFTQDQINGFGEGTDWQDLVFRKAPMQNHNLSVNGGSEKTKFSLGAGYFGQDGIIKNSDYNRTSLRANINHDISKKINVTLGATLSQIVSNRQNSGGGNRGQSLIGGFISAPPTAKPYNDDGTYTQLSTIYPFISNVMVNPLNYIEQTKDKIKLNKILANTAVTYKPFDGFSLKISGGIENSDDRIDGYTTRKFVNSSGNASVETVQNISVLNENIANYAKKFGDHDLSVTAGFTYQNFIETKLKATGSGFISDVSETYDIGAASTVNTPTSSYSKWAMLSYLGRINYSFREKILATVSFRADGSSRYNEGNKWGYFPSAALAYRLSNEEFIKSISFISDLKLRVGYGETGSTAISPYYTLNMLGSGKTVFDDALYTTYAPGTRLPNDLRWETTAQIDFGFDIAFLENRFRLSADYYIKKTRDLLNTVQLPASLGYTNTIQNVGEMENKGLELQLDANVFSGEFKWDLTGNFSLNRNKVIKLYGGQDVFGRSINISVVNDFINILREGHPLGAFYGFVEEDGYDANGQIVYKDFNEDKSLTLADKRFIGDPNPDFIFGLNSNMSFKGFSLSLFVQGSQGNDIFNLSYVNQTVDYGFGLNMPVEVYNSNWKADNVNAKYPRVSNKTLVNISDRFVQDGSYIRLKNIQLAYDIPVGKLGIKWMKNGQVYVSGQNLLTITDYPWYDPEINSYGDSNSINQGIDHYSYPTAKSVTFGVKVGF